jgi:glutamate N-acetyltransferase/amino-acid N-acetyltransferase
VVSRETARSDKVCAIVVNAGCANACTGEQGLADAKRMAGLTAELLQVRPEEVFVCSTGVIGHLLPMPKIEAGIKAACSELSIGGGELAALAIQTTDTFVKRSAYEFILGGKKVTIAGIAKGSGMICPNMATMLAFITTDAAVESEILQNAVKKAADASFNMVVVDGDTSTNDSFIVLANGLAGNELINSENHPDYAAFYTALLTVSKDLAQLIARDGEGATKFLTVEVSGAKNFEQAKTIAVSVARSPLVKTAFFGQDPNWGRIICAAGYAGSDFDPNKLEVSLNGLKIFSGGMGVKAEEEKLSEIMREHDIIIQIQLYGGKAEATVWTCDFSYDYVKINAEYHT